MDSAQEDDFHHFFGDLNQSKKLSEIKPPLETSSIGTFVENFEFFSTFTEYLFRLNLL